MVSCLSIGKKKRKKKEGEKVEEERREGKKESFLPRRSLSQTEMLRLDVDLVAKILISQNNTRISSISKSNI